MFFLCLAKSPTIYTLTSYMGLDKVKDSSINSFLKISLPMPSCDYLEIHWISFLQRIIHFKNVIYVQVEHS